MPGKDVVPPTAQRAGHAVEFGAGAAGEVVDQPVKPPGGEGRIRGEGVEVTQCLFRVVRVGDLPIGVAGGEQAPEALLAPVVEAFGGKGQQLAGPIQRVVFAAP
jgi:hypothetical protein